MKFVDLNIDNLGLIVYLSALAHNSSNDNYFPLPNGTTAGSPYLIDLAITDNHQIRIRTQNDRTNMSAYVILEYTKTS